MNRIIFDSCQDDVNQKVKGFAKSAESWHDVVQK